MSPTAQHEAAAPRRHVLVVDDDPDSAEMLATLLALWGHHASTAFDGAAALAQTARLRPDVVLLDLGLPDADGLEIGRALRASTMNRPRLIAVSGRASPEHRALSAAAGFDAHLVKPVDLSALQRLLTR